MAKQRPLIPLVADPDPAGSRPPPTACAYYAYAYSRGYPPPATAATAATAAAPACAPSAPSYCTATSCAPSYCTGTCTASCAPSYCCTASAASAPSYSASSAPAAATGRCESYALAELGFVFFVEDIKCPQADVGNFLLIESDGRNVLQRWCIRCRRVCCSAARHHQRHPGAQCR